MFEEELHRKNWGKQSQLTTETEIIYLFSQVHNGSSLKISKAYFKTPIL